MIKNTDVKPKKRARNEKTLEELQTKYSTNKPKKKNTKNIVIPESSKELSRLEIIFAEEYLKTHNQTKAYLKIHPNAKTESAGVLGSRMLKRVRIKNYIEERLNPIIEQEQKTAIADANEILEFITAVIRGEVKDQLGFETSVKDRLNASKMLASRYKLFETPKEEEKQEEKECKMIVEIVDNSDLEKTLYEENK